MCSRYHDHASGLIGSPTDPSSRSDDRSWLLRVLRAPLHVRTDRRRRRVQDRRLVPLDDRPPPVLVGEVRRALVHHRRRAVAQRAVHDVAVPGDPADVGRAPVHVLVALQVEDVVVRRRRADEVAGGRVDDPLRLRGRAARVHEEQQILAVHRLARAVVAHVRDELLPAVVATVPHRHVAAGAAEDDRAANRLRRLQRLVGDALQRNRRAAAPCLVLRDEDFAAHVVDTGRERIGGEAAEDDHVRRAETRAGEHRHRQLRDHAHVDRDRRPLRHADRLQAVREAADVTQEVGVRDRPRIARLPFPVIRDLRSLAGLDVPVDAVEADVELPTEEELRVRRLPLVQLRERLEPGDALASFALPELVEAQVVDVRLRVRLPGELRRGRIAPLLQLHRFDRGHGSRSYGY